MNTENTFVMIMKVMTSAIYPLLAYVLVVSWKFFHYGDNVLSIIPTPAGPMDFGKPFRLPFSKRLISPFYAAMFVVCLIVGGFIAIVQVWLWALNPGAFPGSKIPVGVVVALIFSILLFLVKIKSPIVYGVAEGIFAIGSCVFVVDKMSNMIGVAEIVAFFSSIYLTIRSFDNIKKGIDARDERLEKEMNERLERARKDDEFNEANA